AQGEVAADGAVRDGPAAAEIQDDAPGQGVTALDPGGAGAADGLVGGDGAVPHAQGAVQGDVDATGQSPTRKTGVTPRGAVAANSPVAGHGAVADRQRGATGDEDGTGLAVVAEPPARGARAGGGALSQVVRERRVGHGQGSKETGEGTARPTRQGA